MYSAAAGADCLTFKREAKTAALRDQPPAQEAVSPERAVTGNETGKQRQLCLRPRDCLPNERDFRT